MKTTNSKQVLSNLYALMMEINLHRDEEDVLNELLLKPDSQINTHLLKIRKLQTKLKAETNNSLFRSALSFLKEKGMEEIKALLSPAEHAQLVPLFRKFDELTSKDEQAILKDEQMLHLIEILKNRINENTGQ